MRVRLPSFGSIGVIHDTVGQALPIGAFSDARNMRFAGVEMQKMLEPTLELGTAIKGGGDIVNPQWLQFWTDGLSSYAAIAANDTLYVWDDNGVDTGAWRLAGGPYSPNGKWQSFAWGDTVIFNNGIDVPQIYNTGEGVFDDLPEWGLISTGDDILNNQPPSKQVQAACTMLVPFKTFLVACGVTEEGLYQPNKVWWSDSTNNVGYDGAPNWDYETPASLSGQIEIDPESGSINTAVQLNENLVIYTDTSATAMTFVGGTLVMQFRRLFNKGAAGLHCVCEFNNQHFAVAQDQIYLHDGSTVTLIAKDRVEEEFYKRIGKGGRFGDASDIDWDDVQVVKNADRKEVMIVFGEIAVTCVPVSIITQPEDQVPGEGDPTVTFTVVASGTAPITYQWYENGAPMAGENSSTLTVSSSSTSSYYVVVTNDCGTQVSDTVFVGSPCKEYECNIYQETVLQLTGSDLSYYPQVNGWDDVAGYDAGNPPPSWQGVEVIDPLGSRNALISNNVGSGVDPVITGITSDCGGTAFRYVDQTGVDMVRSAQFAGTQAYPFQGTISTVFDTHTAASDGLVARQYAGGADQYYCTIVNGVGSGPKFTGSWQKIGVGGANFEILFSDYGWVQPTDGLGDHVSVRWTSDGAGNSTIYLYQDWVLLGSVTIDYEIPINATQRRYEISFGGDFDKAHDFFSTAAISEGTVTQLADAWAQNQTDYVDPNPNCIPVEAP